jgi:GNAT superfamily N-acetyltransferase
MSRKQALPELTFRPLTADRWDDLVALFGERGASAGCWCMWWRLPHAQFVRQKGPANKRALHKIVDSGRLPGILAYHGKQPVAWCAIGPRQCYLRLEGARVLKKVDEQPVWSVVCLFVARPFRNRGVSAAIVSAAVEHARRRGARIIEAYPVDSKTRRADMSVYTGLASTFRELGFREVVRRSPTRPIMRLALR